MSYFDSLNRGGVSSSCGGELAVRVECVVGFVYVPGSVHLSFQLDQISGQGKWAYISAFLGRNYFSKDAETTEQSFIEVGPCLLDAWLLRER